MKRRDFIRHLERHGSVLDRKGGQHSIYCIPANGRCAAVPRHREIKETTAQAKATDRSYLTSSYQPSVADEIRRHGDDGEK